MSRIKEPIRFRFDERKATAAAALLLELAGGTMEYLRLLKLLYIADREALDALGRPITGDKFVSMKHGPVLSQTYNLIKRVVLPQLPGGGSPWVEHIEGVGRYRVHLKKHPGVGALSEAETAVLAKVFQLYRDHDVWTLRDETHTLPEWEDPGVSSKEIGVEEMLLVLGKSEADIDAVRQSAREAAQFDRLFG